jgi:predicted GH43/DUF377 family glycosyl hydrolase
LDEQDFVEVGDDTPKLEEQARLRGWRAGMFDFGKAATQGVEHFNPGLVRRPDGLWLLVRRSELADGMPYGRNAIWACKLDETLKPIGGPILKFPDSQSAEQFEDPRAVWWNNQTWVGAVNFTWFPDGTWTGAHQMLGVFKDDPDWTPIARRDPPVETNKGEAGFTDGKHQKNWLWWFKEDRLHLLYHSSPWKVIEFGSKWDEQVHYVAEGLKWKYGEVRGGTPPVLAPAGTEAGSKKDEGRSGEAEPSLYWTFFHSSLPWRGRFRRYYMGAIAFESVAPFKPVFITREPLLVGSQNDMWHQRKPLVVFPCGALLENGKWLISYGSNDLEAGWVEIPHEDVVRAALPREVPAGSLLLSDNTVKPVFTAVVAPSEGKSNKEEGRGSESDEKKAAARARMAHARAVMAEKRAKGLLVVKGKRRKRRAAMTTG